MSAPEPSPFPLVGLQVVANAHNQWQAVLLQLPPDGAEIGPLLTALFGNADTLAALAPLDCIVPLADPCALSDSLLELLPPQRVLLSIPAALCFDPAVREKCRQLGAARYRILLDGAPAIPAPAAAHGWSVDGGAPLPLPGQLLPLPGPHLARGVDSGARQAQCAGVGFAWFAGKYALEGAGKRGAADDGASRKRLLALLGLLARDADSRELEKLLKQDPVLSYHLLKLVNSAAFAPSTPINSFGQAINLLGRRQLQRWLQLLLYARQQLNDGASAMLPLAAMRASQMEALCRASGGERDLQDRAFMAGVFSLLDTLLGMPMTEIVGALSLDQEVVGALLGRSGALGQMLALAESGQVTARALGGVGIDAATYWRSLLQAYHWAILVGRDL